MPKITKIEPQKRKGRVNIYIDEKFSFGISEILLIDYDLYEKRDIKKIKAFTLNILVINPDKKLLRIEVLFILVLFAEIVVGKTIIIPK